jgi:hypothetical protein
MLEASIRPVRVALLGALAFALLLAPAGALALRPEGAALVVKDRLTLSGADGGDLVLEPGYYYVSVGEQPPLLVRGEFDDAPRRVAAQQGRHGERLEQPRAEWLIASPQEQHILLLMPDGRTLDAAGFAGAVRQRAGEPLDPERIRALLGQKQAAANVTTRSELVPRDVPEEDAETPIYYEGLKKGLIVLKFKEGPAVSVSYAADGSPASLVLDTESMQADETALMTRGGLDEAAVKQDLAAANALLADPNVERWRPLFDRAREFHEDARRDAQEVTGEQHADLGNYFVIQMKEGQSGEALVVKLRALGSVEGAHLQPIPKLAQANAEQEEEIQASEKPSDGGKGETPSGNTLNPPPESGAEGPGAEKPGTGQSPSQAEEAGAGQPPSGAPSAPGTGKGKPADKKKTDLNSLQGYLDPAPEGIDARFAWKVWGSDGGRGLGVTFFDIEGGWNLDHEDFPPRFFPDATVKAHRLAVGVIDTSDCNTREHGTSVVGEVVAKDDGHGVTGIAPQARWGVVSAVRQLWKNPKTEQKGKTDYLVAEAIDEAAQRLTAGDIILIEQHYPALENLVNGTTDANGDWSGTSMKDNGQPCTANCSQFSYVAMEYFQPEFDAIKRATARGIYVVEAAGNGSMDLDHARYGKRFNRSVRDSGAIVVGASEGKKRRPSEWSNHGTRVDVHAWGQDVVTTGYGHSRCWGAVNPDAGWEFGKKADGSTDRNTWYTKSFGGTSSASPIVVGAVAVLSGIRTHAGLPPLKPKEMRDILVATGTPQTARTVSWGSITVDMLIGPLPDLKKAIPKARWKGTAKE